MDINMVDRLNEILEERGEEFRARVHIVVKPHAVIKGIMLEKGDEKVKPTVYLEGHEEDTVEEYADFCHKAYNANSSFKEEVNMDIDKYMTADYIKETVLPRLTHRDNEERLKRNDTFYLPMLDLLVFFYIPVCKTDDGFQGTITISNHIMELTKLQKQEIMDQAIANMEDDVVIRSMFDVITEMVPSIEDPIDDQMCPRMYVATNGSMINGASVILTEKFRDVINTIFGDKAVIIPSSRHEVIITSFDD